MKNTSTSGFGLLVGTAASAVLACATQASAQQLNIVNCNPQEVQTITAAWGFINGQIRTNARSRAAFVDCIESAQLVDTGSCNVQLNRSAIYLPIIETDYNWRFECEQLDGSANADGEVKIQGARMRFDVGFLGENVDNAIRVAGVMGHELMHNRGFNHGEVTDELYSLTVPEQVEACIQNLIFGGSPNRPPYEDYWDRRECCHNPRHSFSDSRSTYNPYEACTSTPSGNICFEWWEDADTGEVLDGNTEHKDALMCMGSGNGGV